MGNAHTGALRRLCRQVAADTTEALSDREQLDRFLARRDEAAFAALVRRHGPMVLGVCRRLLRHDQDAEDAFQAVFLILARRADAIRKRESLASWLHGVARRVAGKARAQAIQQPAPVRPELEPEMSQREPPDEVSWRELCAVLDDELARLPASCRAALVLCYLQGRTQDEAALQLGWSKSTLRRRLEQGRLLLGARLTRRGVSLPAALGAALLIDRAAAATVPCGLLGPTVRAALGWTADRAAVTAEIPARAAALADGVLRTLAVSRVKLTTAVLLMAGVLAAAAGLLAGQTPAPPPAGKQAGAPAPAAREEARAKAGAPDAPRLDRYGDPLPPGALARMGTVRFRQRGTSALACSPDGKLLAASGGGGVHLWDAATGRELRRLEEDLGDVRCIAFSPDGKTLAFGDMRMGRPVRLWDVSTGKQRGQLGGFIDDPRLPRPPRPVKLCEDAPPPLPFEGHAGPVYSLSFSPDGKLLASSAGDVRLWDLKTRRQLRELVKGARRASLLAFSPDGKTLAVVLQAPPGGAYEDRLLSFWDVASGKELRCFEAHREYVGCIAFSPDGQLLATGSYDKTVRLWDVSTGRQVRALGGHGSRVVSVAFAPDGKALAATAESTGIHLWDPATGKELRRITGHVGVLRTAVFSPDGQTLASDGGRRRIRLYDPATGRERNAAEGHDSWAVSAALSPDARTVYSGGAEPSLRVWETFTGKELRRLEKAGYQGTGLVVTPDGKTLIAASYEYPKGYTLGVWDVATGKQVRQFGARSEKIWRFALAGDGKTVATSGGEELYLWDLTTGKELRQLKGHRRGAYALTLSRDGKLVAGTDGEGTLHLWETATGTHLREWKEKGHQHAGAVAISPDGTVLAAGSHQGMIRLWELPTGKEIGRCAGHPQGVSALAFTPEGRVLVSGGHDNAVRLWEVATGKERAQFRGHQEGLFSVACSADGRVVVSASYDETLLAWDVTGRLHEGRLRAARLALAELQDLWRDLANEDAARAHKAVWGLTSAGDDAARLIAERLRPWVSGARGVERLIEQLDDRQFAVRQRATQELEELGTLAGPALRRRLAGQPSLEVRRRVEKLLERLEKLGPLETQRGLRATEVLEQVATAAARQVLGDLARGASEERLRAEARRSLQRLSRQTKAR
jgi:RNA polymerase sigma factor (sigma-70 family)